MPTSSKKQKTFTISFPDDLARKVERLAKQESRNISELFREAFRTYAAQQAAAAVRRAQELAKAARI
jgi:metal-responsive CopG/Arc/MetJ family transcriptional regulator